MMCTKILDETACCLYRLYLITIYLKTGFVFSFVTVQLEGSDPLQYTFLLPEISSPLTSEWRKAPKSKINMGVFFLERHPQI